MIVTSLASPIRSPFSSSSARWFFLLIATLILFSFADFTNAADVDQDLAEIIEMEPNPAVDGELAHLWFQLMFGEFIWAPWGEGCTSERCATVLSKAIGFTNVLAMLMGLVIAYYLILGGALNTAHSGEVLGKSWSSVWLPVRTATGFGMIVPVAGIGGGALSIIQVFVVWIIILGSNAATLLWNGVATEFVRGTPVLAVNSTLGMEPSLKIFSSLLCVRASLEASHSAGESALVGRVQSKRGGREITATSGNALPSIAGHVRDLNVEAIHLGIGVSNKSCGSIVLPTIEGDIGDRAANVDNQAYAAGVQAARSELGDATRSLESLVNTIFTNGSVQGSGKSIWTGIEDKDETILNLVDNWGERLFTIARDLDNGVKNAVLDAMSDPDIIGGWKERITQGGWANAGSWYFEVSKYQGMVEEIVSSTVSGITSPLEQSCMDISSALLGCDEEEVSYMAHRVPNAIAGAGLALGEQVATAQGNANGDRYTDSDLFTSLSSQQVAATPDTLLSNISGPSAKMILNALTTAGGWGGAGQYGEKCLANVDNGFSSGSQSCEYGASSPFYTVSQMGHALKNIGAIGWAASGIMFATGKQVDKMGGSFTDVVDVVGVRGKVSGILLWMAFTIAPFAGAAIAQSFVLAYVVPFLPLLTWVFMMAGYLLSVVEAVVAAPLAIIMMVTPEGDGISGTRLERAISLIAMIVLKPSLMIIGLVASMTLGNIFFAIMNQFFWTGASQISSWDLVGVAFSMTLYVAMAYKLCMYTVSVMHKLPDQILEWFSSGAARSFGETEIGSVASSVGSAGGQAFNSMGGASLSALRFVRNQQRNDFYRKKAEEGN